VSSNPRKAVNLSDLAPRIASAVVMADGRLDRSIEMPAAKPSMCAFGGPKLWPRVSPSKTWSGFLTGIISGALLGLLIGAQVDMPVWPIFLLGLATGAVAQGGDLLESSFKRHFGVKDTSNLIPGHGGLMDRLDGFIAAAVFACIFGAFRAGIFDPANGLLAW